MQFLDALDGLIEIEPLLSRRTFCVRPDQLALFGVELHVLQQIPEDIVYLYGLLALRRTHPVKESVDKEVVPEDTVWWWFATLLAHEVVKQVWAVMARFVLARCRVLPDIHGAGKAPEYPWPPIPATQRVSSYPDHEPYHG